MTDSFIIGAYWGSRAEPLAQIVDTVKETLIRLSKIDEQFLIWHELGMSRKKALEKKFSIDNDSIQKICLQKVKKGEFDEKGFAKMGFLMGLWTGHKEEESNNISFNVGGSYNTDKLNNSCVLTVPYEGSSKERILQIEKAKAIINVLVELWKPDYAVLTSDNLRDKLNVGNNIGWITYRKSIKRVPRLNSKVVYEECGSGHLFSLNLKGDCYNYNLISELTAIKEIV